MIHKKICAWCQQPLGLFVSANATDEDAVQESHGICIPCIQRHFPAQAAEVIKQVKSHSDDPNYPILEFRDYRNGIVMVKMENTGELFFVSDFDFPSDPTQNKPGNIITALHMSKLWRAGSHMESKYASKS